MDSSNPCVRCKAETPTYSFDNDSTFWGWVGTEVTTTIERRVHVLSSYFRRNPRLGGSPLLESDEKKPLCSDCWGLLVGRFMQGREVPAIPGKEGW